MQTTKKNLGFADQGEFYQAVKQSYTRCIGGFDLGIFTVNPEMVSQDKRSRSGKCLGYALDIFGVTVMAR